MNIPEFDAFLAGFPVFLTHSAVSLFILFIGTLIYMKLTRHDEMALIREGNIAASLSLGAAIVGLALPLAFSLAASASLYDLIIWGVVALLLQIVAFRVMDLFLKDLPERIEKGEMGSAILLVSVKLGTAMINAAAIAG
ncbi:DUF350 domain-containing protein [Temperatibacter marinus]|uniref:DUF350 domain-containing protein n=1 Tax=Temperatibacter marinus TaxID=1456591 RepID=A0AA52EIW0_9PROT|nr:DUF350 domain-containing protein [Temperatibacter marinus]WND03625.1 DUF350 domain-containing protein [Temperatibacter marinus]